MLLQIILYNCFFTIIKNPPKRVFICFIVINNWNVKLLKAEVRNGYLTKVVCGVAETAGSVRELYVPVTSHEAYYWLECAWI